MTTQPQKPPFRVPLYSRDYHNGMKPVTCYNFWDELKAIDFEAKTNAEGIYTAGPVLSNAGGRHA